MGATHGTEAGPRGGFGAGVAVPGWRPKAVHSPCTAAAAVTRRHGQGEDSVSRGEGWRVLFGVPPSGGSDGLPARPALHRVI